MFRGVVHRILGADPLEEWPQGIVSEPFSDAQIDLIERHRIGLSTCVIEQFSAISHVISFGLLARRIGAGASIGNRLDLDVKHQFMDAARNLVSIKSVRPAARRAQSALGDI